MATVINNPGQGQGTGGDGEGASVGLILGIVVAVILVALFVIYGLPAMRGTNTAPGTDVNIQTPPTTIINPPAQP